MAEDEVALETLQDAELIAACRAGRAEAFAPLVERYQDRLFNLALRLTGSADDAAETSQEAFLKAYRGLNSFRGDCGFYTWLYRIAVNVVRSDRRFKAVRPAERSLDAESSQEGGGSLRDGIAGGESDPADEAHRMEQKELVQQALARLVPEQRAMIVLRDIEGRNYAEIAGVLGCPTGTVKSKLHRARMALKELLAPVIGPARAEEK